MCGIIGYTGKKEAAKRLLEGLSALEYRGYDSAGVAFFSDTGKLITLKAKGRLANVSAKVEACPEAKTSSCGIGHTRWATHGVPSDENSHPHGTALLQLVHNGIIENYAELRERLAGEGHVFYSETDTEVAAVLLSSLYEKLGDKEAAFHAAMEELIGSYAFACVFADEPGTLYAARMGSPLIIGVGEGENYVASDVTAILRHTKNYYQLGERDLAVVRPDSVTVKNSRGEEVHPPLETATWDVEAAEKGGYPHFMIKEIHEEAKTLRATLSPRIKNGLPDFSGEGFDVSVFRQIREIHIVACGTAMFAGCAGKCKLEEYAKLRAETEVASEFRYAEPLVGEGDLVIVVSQSGETADTLAALRLAKARGAVTLGVVNVIGSSIAREADHVLYTWAGPEISVCSTKAYTVQAALMTLLAVAAGLARGTLPEERAREIVSLLENDLPAQIDEIIAGSDGIREASHSLLDTKSMFFIGRGADRFLAMEGSLKLKEITYTHSEAYAAGELKHGTISLIEPGTPVVACCTVPAMFEKMLSNIREVKARGARILALCPASAEDIRREADFILPVPTDDPAVSTIAGATSLQLLAYFLAAERGLDVDKPRNLAKSVTVE